VPCRNTIHVFPAYTPLIPLAGLLWVACVKAPPRDAAPPPGGSASPTAASVSKGRPWIPTSYVAVGDSFTIGTGSTPDRSFPARLASRWPASLANLGVNGFTTSDVIDRELPQLPLLHPDFTTLAIGANDIVRGVSAERYRAHLQTIFAALAQSVPRCHVVALPQPDWSASPAARSFGSPETIGAKIRDFNGMLKQEAVGQGARYVDLFPLMRRQADARMIASDGLHPSAAAYDEWAEAIGRVLDTDPLPASCP
jgi:acyl-CoA thioesterase-1